MIMQKLIGNRWVDCSEEDLLNGDVYRVSAGGGWQQQVYIIPEATVIVTPPESGQIVNAGEVFNVTASFSDKTINGPIPVSVTNRSGEHVYNILITVTNGEGAGLFTPPDPIDYFITNEGINFHKDAIPSPLKLSHEFYLRAI